MRDLGDVMYAMELRHNERETRAKLEFQSLMDELKNKVRETGSSLLVHCISINLASFPGSCPPSDCLQRWEGSWVRRALE